MERSARRPGGSPWCSQIASPSCQTTIAARPIAMIHSSTTPGPVSAIVGQRALLVHPLPVPERDLDQQPGQQQVHHAVGDQPDPAPARAPPDAGPRRRRW